MTSEDYLTGLPSTADIRESLSYAYDYWQPRNKFIAAMREMLTGQNKIAAPASTPYKIRILHTYLLAAVVNEKAARFTQLPTIQAVPNDSTDDSRVASSELELAINIAFNEMERRSDGDVWARAALDAIVLDEGVERIERAPAAFWPDVVTIEDGKMEMPFETELSKVLNNNKKKEYGLPLRSIYVPLENFYPIYEGPNIVQAFEVELRSLRNVLRNPLFEGSKGILEGYNRDSTDARAAINTQISIVHFVNSKWHAYYALTPAATTNSATGNWPNLSNLNLTNIGEPVLLHAYEHNLGQTIYNCLSGRFGGWKSSTNRIEGVANGLLELNQVADELLSQVLTNVRAKYWPTLLQKVDQDQRGYAPGGSDPKPLVVPEGQNLVIYKDEEVEPLFKPVDDPILPWIWNVISEQIGRLGGSSVVFGQNQPGVETGYHQALQITQSEHLDEKIEQHLSIGAVNRATIMLKHIRAMDMGEVFVHATETDGVGKKMGRYYSINPNHLSPMPRLDAQVRRPRPVDFAASIRAAREASDERQGKGPLLSDDTIRQDLLNNQAPNIENHKILVESQKRKLVASGVLDMKIAEALNLKLLAETTGAPEGTPAPAAVEGVRRVQAGQQQPQPAAPVQPSTAPLETGMTTGQSQPEAVAGTAITNALATAQ